MLLSFLPSLAKSEEEHGLYLTDTYNIKKFSQLEELIFDEQKENTPMISPFILKDGEEHFIKENIIGASCLIIDIDDSISVKRCIDIVTKLNLRSMIYTTHKHQDKEGLNRFRLILPFRRPLKIDDFESLAYGIRRSKLWKALRPDESTLTIPRRFILPPANSKIYYTGGEFFPTDKFIAKGSELKAKDEFEKLRSAINSSYKYGFKEDDGGEKHIKYYEKIVANKAGEFRSGNRDNWLFKMINLLKQKHCSPDNIHFLLDEYIALADKSSVRKFNKMINK